MNTVKSVYYGWATLIVAGGGAYFFAKRSINADRAAKAEADHQKRLRAYELEQAHFNKSSSAPPGFSNSSTPVNTQQPMQSGVSTTPGSQSSKVTTSAMVAEAQSKRRNGGGAGAGGEWEESEASGNPSQEASQDPAPTRHAPVDGQQEEGEKSKYEATQPFRSRKGDRFS